MEAAASFHPLQENNKPLFCQFSDTILAPSLLGFELFNEKEFVFWFFYRHYHTSGTFTKLYKIQQILQDGPKTKYLKVLVRSRLTNYHHKQIIESLKCVYI